MSCTVAVLIDAGYVVGSDAGGDADVEGGSGVSEGPLSQVILVVDVRVPAEGKISFF